MRCFASRLPPQQMLSMMNTLRFVKFGSIPALLVSRIIYFLRASHFLLRESHFITSSTFLLRDSLFVFRDVSKLTSKYIETQ